ncbi:malto-oligosyltrehalose synthase [Fodinicola feengrottensis]|uniref:Malto-oligosyltrehalose synthase n=1 Tax=Fodinicola feengrottensis TaxID=435914 RepID=A0ABN2HMR3_9ACTN|nr:malto-oligosyltrehalose synthase [Fodinicola feengrottensis]
MTTRPVLSTYRLQLRRELDFAAAAELVDYLAELGVSHLYASPILQATAGSAHGYDVVDPTRISADLGGPDGFDALVERLHAAGLGIVVDVVPNHMGVQIPKQNAWWWDVLKNGRHSAYAHYFDIDWTRPRIALPILGAEPGELGKLRVENGELAYGEHRLPIADGTGTGSPAEVHDQQHYQLVPWNAGEVGYRRFFMVNTLAAVRQEDAEVFQACHQQLLPRVVAGQIDGLRIDHPDGMASPSGYLAKLAEAIPAAWIVIEKILATDEKLEPGLPVAGTTGYQVMRLLDGVFVDPAGEGALTDLSERLTADPGDRASLDRAEHDLKLDTASTGLRPELRRIARLIGDVPNCVEALAELAACVPVYRADYPCTTGELTAAVAEAAHRSPHLESALSVVAAVLATDGEATTRFHQTTGAITAKSIEDKLFYRTTRLTSLNEVGGDPRRFAVTPGEFHLGLAEQALRWPAGMTTLSTHDTKRAVDVRARIAVLSEIPAAWAEAVDSWNAIAAPPEPSIGYLLWQTLVGVWPADGADRPDPRRMHAYAEKAVREAGLVTNWDAVDTDFEKRLHDWLDTVLNGPLAARIGAFVGTIAQYGWSNSLGATLLQLAGPGVPDTYAGCELWDDSLVDPDNRRPVDFALRRKMLGEHNDRNRPPAVDASGAAKLWLISRALRARHTDPDTYVGGGYQPLIASRHAADHAISFCRRDVFGAPKAIAVATRLPAGLHDKGGWLDTELALPAGTWTDALTGSDFRESVGMSALLEHLPIALLTRS